MNPLEVKSVKEYNVLPVPRNVIRNFIEEWHYTHSINGLQSSYCFGLYCGDELIGAMIYGGLGMANVWKKYGETKEEVLELRRLCLIDDTKRNAESYFIGKTLKWLRKNTTVKTIVSYADPNHGHEGIIYKATNFTLVGKTTKTKVIKYGDKIYHDKAIRTKYKGELKPFAQRLVDALNSGEAYYIEQEPKNIYVKELIK
ncbi:DNA modification [Enterococcus phage vB_EfaS_Ef5.2]|nr:DNA modification [Enterococcus phage vB_EfaS_Ef5.2]